jgi:uncharacterized protein YqfA (UPF0365 family)
MQEVQVEQSDVFIVFMVFAVLSSILFLIVALVFYGFLFRPWVRAAASGAPISVLSILGMRLRGNPVTLLVDAFTVLKHSGIDVSIADVELAYIKQRTRVRTADDLVGLIKENAESRSTES